MKKTLIICNHYPLPENVGTNIRTMNFVRFFLNRGTVDVAYSHTLPGAKTGNPVFRNEYFLKRESCRTFTERLKRWTAIGRRPLPIPKYEDDDEKQLMSLIETNDYDYILVRYIVNTWCIFNSKGKHKMRTIVDFDDILSDSLYKANLPSAPSRLREWRLNVNRKYLAAYEKRCLSLGPSLFCSKKDMAKIADGYAENAFVIPNIYDNPTFQSYPFGEGFYNGNTLLFVGTLNYAPNVEGLLWFIDTVFEDFRQRYPDSKLLVVGRSPSEEVRKACGGRSDIALYADASDIREHYKQCRATVVPLLAGGGTRIKILEAALAGRPVLSTPVGAEGLELEDNLDILLFRNGRDFCEQYGKLSSNKRYEDLVRNASDVVSQEYSVDAFHASMDKVLRCMNNGRP